MFCTSTVSGALASERMAISWPAMIKVLLENTHEFRWVSDEREARHIAQEREARSRAVWTAKLGRE